MCLIIKIIKNKLILPERYHLKVLRILSMYKVLIVQIKLEIFLIVIILFNNYFLFILF